MTPPDEQEPPQTGTGAASAASDGVAKPALDYGDATRPPASQTGEQRPPKPLDAPPDAAMAEIEKVRADVDAKLAEALERIGAIANSARDDSTKAVAELQTWLKDEMTAHRQAIDSHAENFNKGLSDVINAQPEDERPAGFDLATAPTKPIEQRLADLEAEVAKLKGQIKSFV